MSDIVWEDPPERARLSSGKWARFTAELQKHPGKWALVPTPDPRNVANQKSRLAVLGCEVRQAGTSGRDATLYARWPEDAS